MKNKYVSWTMKIGAALAAAATLAGCGETVDLSGSYSTPAQTISGSIDAATNSVSVSGAVDVKN